MNKVFFSFLLIILLAPASFSLLAQPSDTKDMVSQDKATDLKGFHLGLYSGVLFANKYTAVMYDGYGYDLDGKKNDFFNSFMYRKIYYEYGGGNGQTDRIAQALNVNPGDWTFSSADMPINMRYSIAFALGAHMRYCFNNKEAIILNVNASKLNVNGNFTITMTTPYISSQPPGTENTRTFSIIGAEQRLLFQLGYQAIGGEEDEALSFFMEIGPMVSLVKFDKNQISINSLQIPLTVYYDQLGYVTYRAKVLTGVGIGAFAGVGMNLNMSKKWTMQLLYSPSFERISLGDYHKFKLQQTAGFRAYYNL